MRALYERLGIFLLHAIHWLGVGKEAEAGWRGLEIGDGAKLKPLPLRAPAAYTVQPSICDGYSPNIVQRIFTMPDAFSYLANLRVQ
jgi:hypothetical protein